ncbi:MAG: hypothetical protein WCI61_10820, partial [Chloroflexota bacterium]
MADYWNRISNQAVSRRGVLRGAAIGASGLAGAALIGCGGGAKSDDAGAKPGAAGSSAAGAPATKRKGGVLRTAIAADPPNWSVFTAATYT